MDSGNLQPLSPSNGQTGLTNLGNSCYMNSALQCLLHIPELNYYFLSEYYKQEINPDNPLGNGGVIAQVFAQLVNQLFNLKRSQPSAFSPRDFKQTIGSYNSMFSSYHQQDSQEFLSYLLDGLHEDLNRIVEKPYTEKPELTNTEYADSDQIRELAVKSWDTHKLRNDSIINDLFVGLYKSTLVCPQCKKISVTFDPYNALTLPLPTDQKWYHQVLILLETGYPKSFEVELPKTATFNDLKNYLSEKLSIPTTELICMEVFNHQFFKNYESKDADIGYMPIDGLIQKDDLIIFYQIKASVGDIVVPVFNTWVNESGSEARPFGIPFFITLSEEDRLSFGVIRQKLESRYDQLSTYNYFSQVRSKQKFSHALNDFPLLEDKYGDFYKEKLAARKSSASKDDVDEEGYESDISLANPDIPGDYAFDIKLFDSSKEMKSRYSYPASYNQFERLDVDDELWVPKTSNNFKNLPSLLDKLTEDKRRFYTYNENTFEDSLSSKENETSVEIEVAQTDDFPGLDEALENMDKDGDESMDLGPALSLRVNSEIASSEDTPSSPSGDVTPDDPLDSTTSAVKEVGPTTLVSEKVALVCEWQQDLFGTFFAGMEEEGEGGKETWTTPEVIPNFELISKRELEKERSKDSKSITLYDCLKLFEQPEILSDQDLWYCPSCKEHTNATKSLEIWSTPDILTVHLKRFESQRSLSDKIDDVVEFPITGLDVAPYVVSDDTNETVYDLFAVDNHYGGLGGGHYTAFVKNFVDDNWYYFDDSRVHPRDPKESVTGSAYLLFYRRRRDPAVLGNDMLREVICREKKRQEEEVKNDIEKIQKMKEEYEEKQRQIAEQKRIEEEHEAAESLRAEDADDEADDSNKFPSSEESNSSSVSSNSVPVSASFNPSLSTTTLHHPQAQPATLNSATSIPPLRKKRKGNLSSPILSPLQPSEDLLLNQNNNNNNNNNNLAMVESDLESVKEGFSPGLVPSTGGKTYHSSGLVESPISTFGNDDDEEE